MQYYLYPWPVLSILVVNDYNTVPRLLGYCLNIKIQLKTEYSSHKMMAARAWEVGTRSEHLSLEHPPVLYRLLMFFSF